MQDTPTTTGLNEHDSTSPDEDVFIPIDPDWQKKYYKRVLSKRIKSYWLDFIILYIFLFVIFIILALSVDKETYDYLVNDITTPVCLFAYPVLTSILESSRWKGSFGKRIMKIEVTDNYGNTISFWRSIGRNLLKGITFYFCLTIVGYYIQKHYYLKSGKLIHDNWTNTIIGERLTRH